MCRKLIANLLVSFLSCGDRMKRVEILTVLGDILNFDPEQRKLIGLEQHTVMDEYSQPRLSELWAAFLLGQS
jgi:hypothetical protein